jgi:hypothetical protein
MARSHAPASARGPSLDSRIEQPPVEVGELAVASPPDPAPGSPVEEDAAPLLVLDEPLPAPPAPELEDVVPEPPVPPELEEDVPPELLEPVELLELEEGIGTVSAWSAASVPSNLSRSTALAPGMPETVPLSSYCQKGHLVNGAGTSGQDTPQLAIQSCA